MPTGLIAGVHYPANLLEFQEWFGSEQACVEWLAELRWADGWVCTRCGGVRFWATTRGRRKCAECRATTTVTSGTVFDKTRTTLSTWFMAAWLFSASKQGLSALELQRLLGHSDYQTCWLLLHKFRAALGAAEREPLTGRVEVDETFVGGVERDPRFRGRGMSSKTIVVVAVEQRVEAPAAYQARHRRFR